MLNQKITAALNQKSVKDRFDTLSLEATQMDRPTAARYIESEVQKWGKLVKDMNLQVE